MQHNFPTPRKIFHCWGTFSHELLRAQNRHFLSIDPNTACVLRGKSSRACPGQASSVIFSLPSVAWDYIARTQPAHGMRETMRDIGSPRGKPLTATDSPILWVGYVRAKIIPHYRWNEKIISSHIASTCEALAINIPFLPVASSTTFYSSKRLEFSF